VHREAEKSHYNSIFCGDSGLVGCDAVIHHVVPDVWKDLQDLRDPDGEGTKILPDHRNYMANDSITSQKI
jgi:hypothetical protein